MLLGTQPTITCPKNMPHTKNKAKRSIRKVGDGCPLLLGCFQIKPPHLTASYAVKPRFITIRIFYICANKDLYNINHFFLLSNKFRENFVFLYNYNKKLCKQDYVNLILRRITPSNTLYDTTKYRGYHPITPRYFLILLFKNFYHPNLELSSIA